MNMDETEVVKSSQYLQIALDIASRIERSELKEGSKIYGRSVLAAEYGVSPETIRRSLKLLSDMEVVEIKEKSGVFIRSAGNASKYIKRFSENSSIRALQTKLKNIIAEHGNLSRQMSEIAIMISKFEQKVSPSTPFINYEVSVEDESEAVGKSLKELRFWQATGATIIAIRRDGNIILSPGPYAQLLVNDRIVFIGDTASAEAVAKFVGRKQD